jgi:hypothetical protein
MVAMRIIRGMLTIIGILALAVGTILLVGDPRLRDLVAEDLALPLYAVEALLKGGSLSDSAGFAGPPPEKTGESSNAGGSTRSSPQSKAPPTVTAGGYTIASGCGLWTVEGVDLYYSPTEPKTICVQPPGNPTQAGSQYTPGSTQLPPNCDVSPDSVVYCVIEGELSADTLRAFYDRGELNTPRESERGRP